MGSEKSFSVFPTPRHPVAGNAARQDDDVRQAAQRDGRVDVGQRRGQRNRRAAGGRRLQAEQLKQRAEKNINARTE